MKLKLNYFAVACLFAIVTFFSCSRQSIVSPVPDSNYKVTLVDSGEAALIAGQINQENLFDLSKPNAGKKVESGMTFRDSRDHPAFYVFSYEEGGFVVIAADKNMSPLLAYSAASKFKGGEIPYGLMLWLQKTAGAVELVRKGIYDNSQSATWEWKFIEKRLQKENTGGVATREPPVTDPCSGVTHNTKDPLVQVTWGQGCDYNASCPVATGGPCGRAWTGCVATAMAQIMHYWRAPASYNWAAMPLASGNSEVARLMRDVGNAVDMDWGADGSGADHNKIEGAFKNTFGYSSASNTGYNRTSVLNSLTINRPVILSGYDSTYTTTSWLGLVTTTHYVNGHEWVCDGYNIYTNPCMSIVYLHMNWGWHEWFTVDDHSGWFRDFNWSIPGTDQNYQYYKRAIVFIRN